MNVLCRGFPLCFNQVHQYLTVSHFKYMGMFLNTFVFFIAFCQGFFICLYQVHPYMYTSMSYNLALMILFDHFFICHLILFWIMSFFSTKSEHGMFNILDFWNGYIYIHALFYTISLYLSLCTLKEHNYVLIHYCALH